MISSPPPQPPAPQQVQPRGRACWQSSALDFLFHVLWTSPILGAFWAKVYTISPGQMQKEVTLQTPSPTYYYIIHLWPLNNTSRRNAVEVALVIPPACWRPGVEGPKGKHAFLYCLYPFSFLFLFDPISLISGPVLHDCQPTQESSRTAWWITLHPQAKHSTRSNNYTNRHGHIPPHTHILPSEPYISSVHQLVLWNVIVLATLHIPIR